MQLSNEPAEALAKYLVESSDGAFEIVGFASGGMYCLASVWTFTQCELYRQRSDGWCHETRSTSA